MSCGGSRFGREDLMNSVVIEKMMMGYGMKWFFVYDNGKWWLGIGSSLMVFM
jgi:hypothetical protein